MIRAKLTKYKVSKLKQDRLLKAYAAGKLWDSENGAKPASTSTKRSGDFVTTISRFKDGSITASTTEDPIRSVTASTIEAPIKVVAAFTTDVSEQGKSIIQAKNISNCDRWTSGGTTYRKNCLISWDAITWWMNFRANYQFNKNGSSITRLTGQTYGGAGSFDSPHLRVLNKNAGKNSRSRAQGSVVQSGGPLFGRTVGINLTVSTNGGRTDSFG